MKAAQFRSNIVNYCFPNAALRSEAWTPNNTTQKFEKYGSVAGYALADTLLIGPKILLGTRAGGTPRVALNTTSLTATQRGVVGCLFFAAAKLVQLSGALVGAAAGTIACAVGTLIGQKSGSLIDLGAGKGWQLGTIVATIVMTPSELLRTAFWHATAFVEHVIEYPLSAAGSILGQTVEVFCTAPKFSAEQQSRRAQPRAATGREPDSPPRRLLEGNLPTPWSTPW